MIFSAMFAFLFLFQIYILNVSSAKEPMCSKFAYEEQLLEKMIRTEIKVETMEKEIRNTLSEIKETAVKITEQFEEFRNDITEEMGKKTKQFGNVEELLKKSFEELRTNLTNDIDDQRKSLIEPQERMAQPSVAFYAHYVTNTMLYTTGEIIKFDRILTNEGSGYDTSTGIFTAPIGGTYQFTVHMCTYYGKHSFIGLVHAGDLIASTANYDKDHNTCNSVGAIVKVKSGEQVWVKCTAAGSNYRLIEGSSYMNTFSGILLNSRP